MFIEKIEMQPSYPVSYTHLVVVITCSVKSTPTVLHLQVIRGERTVGTGGGTVDHDQMCIRDRAYPAPEILREESKVQPEAAAPAKVPQSVTPILLNGQNSACLLYTSRCV